MLEKRIIPCLLLCNNLIVKTIQFSDPKPISEPIYAIKIFNDYKTDEIIILDIGISKKQNFASSIQFDIIEKISDECWMPITYGGGITTINEMKKLFCSGVEKICINSGAIDNPNLINDAVEIFGSQSICIGIDIKKNPNNTYSIYKNGGQTKINTDLFAWIHEVISRGAGELLLYSIDNDGMMNGFDTEILGIISSSVSVPVVAAGGCGSYRDISYLFDSTSISGAAIGSLFVYFGKKRRY